MTLTETIHRMIDRERQSCDLSEAWRSIFGMIDLTTLEGTDHPDRIRGLCDRARQSGTGLPGGNRVAAVCVYPVFAGLVSRELKGSGITTACVAGAFPSGQSPLGIRLDEVRYALDEGAKEIDMVISRGRLLAGDEDFVREEVRRFAELCQGRAHLKVILETGELATEELTRKACRLALEGGADFLKTSTGKIQPGATLEAFYLMLDEIRMWFERTGKAVGVKAAGGIAEPETALQYYLLTKAVLGAGWLTRERLRFGASKLADKLAILMGQP